MFDFPTAIINTVSTAQVILLMSIGPQTVEIKRLADFLEAVFKWEPTIKSLVLIDDAPEPRHFEELFGMAGGVHTHIIHHPRLGTGEGVWGALTEGILLGLDWIAVHEPAADLVLKIDTDALVINKFISKATAFLDSHSTVGLLGLHDQHCSGEHRSFQPWDRAMLNYSLPVGTRRTASGKRGLRWQLGRSFRRQHRILRSARSNGYRWGEHCLGGAYLLRAQTVRDMHRRGFLMNPEFWRHSLVGEDVVVAAYVKAAGWHLHGFAAKNEIFGVEYVGLPFPPGELEARGYSIIHSVKNHPSWTEERIRSFFRGKREAATQGCVAKPLYSDRKLGT